MADRPRREKQDKLSKLAELKRVREGGKREYQERESVVYDEVTEEQYRVRIDGYHYGVFSDFKHQS
jgi:DNA polymerase alpha subunit A